MTIHYLDVLSSHGVKFRSYTQEYLSTEDPLVAHILIGVNAHYAEYEAQRISRRTKAGLRRARAQGKVLGAPSRFELYREQVEQLMASGTSRKGIARATGLSYNTVKKYLGMIDEDEQEPRQAVSRDSGVTKVEL